MQVAQVMSRQPRVISPDLTIREAAVLMREIDSGFLPVGENDRLIGTVTDRDIALRAVAEGKDPNSCSIREILSEHVAYCFEDQDVEEAAEIMSSKQIRRLPVLNRGKRLVGVVTLGDLAERGQAAPVAGHALEEVCRHTGQARAM
ncbi:MAG: CBS domain-containing protein [Magnetospirillum sp.]|nr:CBS domain-containing protein [Magnetospirillum sp.]